MKQKPKPSMTKPAPSKPISAPPKGKGGRCK